MTPQEPHMAFVCMMEMHLGELCRPVGKHHINLLLAVNSFINSLMNHSLWPMSSQHYGACGSIYGRVYCSGCVCDMIILGRIWCSRVVMPPGDWSAAALSSGHHRSRSSLLSPFGAIECLLTRPNNTTITIRSAIYTRVIYFMGTACDTASNYSIRPSASQLLTNSANLQYQLEDRPLVASECEQIALIRGQLDNSSYHGRFTGRLFAFISVLCTSIMKLNYVHFRNKEAKNYYKHFLFLGLTIVVTRVYPSVCESVRLSPPYPLNWL